MPGIGPMVNESQLGDALAVAQTARLRRQAEQAAAAGADDTRSLEDLEHTAREFEGVFLNNLLKAMRATVPDNKLFNGGGPTKFYQQMHDAEMAKALSEGSGGMGLARLIVQQFEQSVGREEAAKETERTELPTRLGPPAPLVLERYRATEPPAVNEAVRAAQLRGLAAGASVAEADTLRRFGPEISRAAAAADLDPRLVLAVVMEESGGDPAAESPVGARGLMQLMPETAAEVGVSDPLDPAGNLGGGSRYLSEMLERYGGRLDIALAAYNAGPGNVDRAGGRVPNFPETRTYVRRVLDRYQGLGGGTELDKWNP